MKQKITKLIGMVALVIMMVTLNASAVFADFGTGTVHVPINQVMTLAEEDVSRSKDYSFYTIGAISVYPSQVNKEDNFKKCKTQLFMCNTGTTISKIYVLEEGALYSKVYLNEGRLNLSMVDIKFSGNSDTYPAYVNYYYNGN